MKKRIALFRGLWLVLTKEWVPHTPVLDGQTCAIYYRGGADGNMPTAVCQPLDRLAVKRGWRSILHFNDDQSSRWPVVRLYLSALVRG